MSIRDFLGGDLTPLEHAIYAVLMWGLTFAATFWLGELFAIGAATAFPVAFFFGREHAQQQGFFYETEQPLGDWEAAAFWLWPRSSQMDFYCPTLAALLAGGLALLMT